MDRFSIVGVILAGLAGTTAANADDSVAKDRFNLFNPTPRPLMREMSTDRPDRTESPYTVDAGHVQIELSLIDFAHNDDGGVETDAISILPTNLKIGLLNNVDIQFVFTPYVNEDTEIRGTKNSANGFSDDTQIRLKINLWGNDGGATAFALMPFVKFPTGSDELSNGHVEGGLIVPLAISLPHEFDLGLMAEFDAVHNESTGDYGIDFVHTATISHDLIGNLAGYIEYIGIAPHETGKTYQAIGSGGLTFAINGNWVLDCGGTIGISSSVDDFSVFAGTSYRY